MKANGKPKRSGCTCGGCVAACRDGRPGWFAPGEADGLDPKLLIRDYRCPDRRNKKAVVVLRPRIIGETGTITAFAPPRGRCVFLNAKNRCDIYSRRPKECRVTFCCRPRRNHRIAIANEWRDAGYPLGSNTPQPTVLDGLMILIGGLLAKAQPRDPNQ